MARNIEETKADHLRTVRIIREGYAGMMPNGNIVDRRVHPEAVAVEENDMFGNPKPKRLRPKDLKLDCENCIHMIEHEEPAKWGSRCGKCGRSVELLKKIAETKSDEYFE